MTSIPAIRQIIRAFARAPARPSVLTLIIPDRTEIPGYVPPKVEGGHRCATLWGTEATYTKGRPDWHKLAATWTDPAQLKRALALANAAPEGARAVLLSGMHGNTDGDWWLNAPRVGNDAWYHGWNAALDALAREMRRMGFPRDTLIIGQSEHYPASRWFRPWLGLYPYANYNVVAAHDPADRWYGPDQVAPAALASCPGPYWTDHSIPFGSMGGILHTMAACRAAGSELVPFVTEPVPGEEKAWQLMVESFAALGGVRRMILFANHNGNLNDHKGRIEAAWPVKAGG